MDGEPEHLSQDHRCSMKSTMGSAGELDDIPSMSGTAQYAGVECAALPVNKPT
jgi:hypothetical protein